MGLLAAEWMRVAVTHAWQVTALIVLTAIAIRLSTTVVAISVSFAGH